MTDPHAIDASIIEKTRKTLATLTLEEKASLCSGSDFWHLQDIESAGIPSIMVTDGPHGLRKQAEASDHVGINASVPSTCFPSGVGLASSWNTALLHQVGVALGEESKAEQVSVILGPAVNIKRSPLCGRNFEYFSEDPYLATQLAIGHIQGVQSQGIGTSIKHFAANNQEHRRMTVDTIVDERTLREIYLASFETAVIEAKPWTVMSAYNKINGTYASEHPFILDQVLRQEWGYEGVVVTDWGANNDRVAGVKVGEDLEMPGTGGYFDRKIVEAVQAGELSMEALDKVVTRVLTLIFKSEAERNLEATYDQNEHHQLAIDVASECMVLLKNDAILPLQKTETIGVIGSFAKAPRYQGGGSSHINPTQMSDAFTSMANYASHLIYAQGFDIHSDDSDAVLTKEALDLAKKVDKVVIFAGLPDRYESEGYDRKHMHLPPNQNTLIHAVAEVNPNVVVVLSNGSPVEMPWVNEVAGIFEGYLGGQGGGSAIAALLYGAKNPSGKLAETFPLRLEDNPSYLNFPGHQDRVEYKEGIYVGYRYYEAKNIPVLFPFGHGLSYTTFAYSDLSLSSADILDTETVDVTVTVTNTGQMAGQEVVQLYVADVVADVPRPLKELKAFSKVNLAPGESQTITFTLSKRAFAYYHTELHDWYVETGAFNILVGSSSVHLPLSDMVTVTSTTIIKHNYNLNSTVADVLKHPVGAHFVEKMKQALPFGEVDADDTHALMFEEMMKGMPVRQIMLWSNGAFSEEMLNGLLAMMNE